MKSVPAARFGARHVFFLAGAIGTLAVLALRLALARHVDFCGWRDGCFYLTLAKEFAAHHDFLVPFVWNYQVGDISLPNQALEYWRPGASFIYAIAAFFGGVSLRASVVMTALATFVLSLAAAALAWRATRDRAITLLAYLLCLCLPPLWTMPLTPDAGMFYAVAVAWFLALVTVDRGKLGIELLGVALIGVAYLIRNDAIILGAPLVAVLGKRLYDARKAGALAREARRAALLFGAFILALLPTHLLIYGVTGHFLNGDITRVIFFTRNEDFDRYGSAANLSSWAAIGLLPLLKLRVATFFLTVHRLLDLCGEFATVLAAAGAVIAAGTKRRHYGWRLIGPAVFLVALIGFYVLVMPTIAQNAVSRSFAGFLPALAVLAAIAAKEVATSPRVYAAIGAAALFFCIGHGMSEARGLLGSEYTARFAEYRNEARLITANLAPGQRAVAMVSDPAPFTTTTGIPSVPLPSNGLAATEAAIKHYGVSDVVADSWRSSGALATALDGARVSDVPGTSRIVIALPHGADQKPVTAKK